VGERLLRELQLQAQGRVLERRNLLLDERNQGASRAVESSPQHHTAAFFAGLQAAGTGGLDAQKLGVWRSGNRYALLTSPHARRRLSIYKDNCATLINLAGTKKSGRPLLNVISAGFPSEDPN